MPKGISTKCTESSGEGIRTGTPFARPFSTPSPPEDSFWLTTPRREASIRELNIELSNEQLEAWNESPASGLTLSGGEGGRGGGQPLPGVKGGGALSGVSKWEFGAQPDPSDLHAQPDPELDPSDLKDLGLKDLDLEDLDLKDPSLDLDQNDAFFTAGGK